MSVEVMNFLEQMNSYFRPPLLTWTRMVTAVVMAMLADSLQFFTGPAGWAGMDQVIDLVAMLLTAWAIGFHLLLLPTFLVEFFPVMDMLPTWTACVIAVIALRKREQKASPTGLPTKSANPPKDH